MNIPRSYIYLFLLQIFCTSYFYSAGGGNQAARFNQTRAIATQWTLYNGPDAFPSDDHLYLQGHVYSNKAPGTSLLGVVPFIASTMLLQPPIRMAKLHSPWWQNLPYHFTTIITVGIPAALGVVGLFHVLLGMKAGISSALFGAIALGMGTIYFPYSTMYFGHALAGAFGMLTFALLRHVVVKGESVPIFRWVFWAGLLTGLAVLIEYPAIILALCFTLYLLLRLPPSAMVPWIAGGSIGACLLLLYNLAAFGNPIAVSYLNYSQSAYNSFPELNHGVVGMHVPDPMVLKEILIGESRGLLLFSPVCALVIPGIAYLVLQRRDLWPEYLTAILAVSLFLAFNAGYGDSVRYWGGANGAGPRHLIPMLPLLALFIAFASAWIPRFSYLWLVPSIWLSLATTAVMPQVPMLFRRPLTQFIVPYALEGRYALHRGGVVTTDLITADSIAYNPAKLWGWPGELQLVPLVVGAAILLWLLLNQLRLEYDISSSWVRNFAWAAFPILAVTAGSPTVYRSINDVSSAGPGIWSTYRIGPRCDAAPVWQGREQDFNFRFDVDRVRRWPGEMCAEWRTYLRLEQPMTVPLRFIGGPTILRVNGAMVPLQATSKMSRETHLSLEAGRHLLEVETDFSLVLNRFDMQWNPSGNRWESIPGVALEAAIPGSR